MDSEFSTHDETAATEVPTPEVAPEPEVPLKEPSGPISAPADSLGQPIEPYLVGPRGSNTPLDCAEPKEEKPKPSKLTEVDSINNYSEPHYRGPRGKNTPKDSHHG